MIIKLTPEELKYASEVARKRNASQREGNRADGKVLQDSLTFCARSPFPLGEG